MRPDDARPSINAALRALHTNNAGEMQAAATGAFTFVGWLSTDGCVIDQHGEICGELQPGDHMVTWDTPEEMAAAFGLKR